MAASHGSLARVYYGGYDLSGYLKSMSVGAEIDTNEVTTYGNTTKVYIAGLRDAKISMEGLYDGAANAIDAVLSAAMNSGTSAVLTYMITGDADGYVAYAAPVVESSYQIETPVDDVASIGAEFQCAGNIQRGIVVKPLANVVAGGNGTSFDNAAATTNSWAAFLQCTAVGAGTLTVKVQDSADGTTWLDLTSGTFANVTVGTRSSQMIAGATGATVRRYVRALWTITGNATFNVVFSRL